MGGLPLDTSRNENYSVTNVQIRNPPDKKIALLRGCLSDLFLSHKKENFESVGGGPKTAAGCSCPCTCPGRLAHSHECAKRARQHCRRVDRAVRVAVFAVRVRWLVPFHYDPAHQRDRRALCRRQIDPYAFDGDANADRVRFSWKGPGGRRWIFRAAPCQGTRLPAGLGKEGPANGAANGKVKSAEHRIRGAK